MVSRWQAFGLWGQWQYVLHMGCEWNKWGTATDHDWVSGCRESTGTHKSLGTRLYWELLILFTNTCLSLTTQAWCPFERHTLATGSGTADRHIRFYDTLNGNLMNSIDTKSQVCSLLWSTHEKELLSSHGYSKNQLTLWKYPTMTKVLYSLVWICACAFFIAGTLVE